MRERDMEELIARYPAEFFPRHEFTLVDRQGLFPGVGRYDLLFKDGWGTTVLMELKARPAKYADADQLAKYHGALKAAGQTGIMLWLVAPNIPTSVREFLDNIGIEYTEIHVAEYNRIAEKFGYDVVRPEQEDEARRPAPEKVRRPKSPRVGHAEYRSRVKPIFAGQVEKLAGVFDAGYRFLRDLGDNRIPGFYIWTGTNAHLYYRDGYYSYIVPNRGELKLRGRFNGQISSAATDNNEFVFPGGVRRLIQELDGFKSGWANEAGEWVILRNATPAAFFEGLLELIRTEHK